MNELHASYQPPVSKGPTPSDSGGCGALIEGTNRLLHNKKRVKKNAPVRRIIRKRVGTNNTSSQQRKMRTEEEKSGCTMAQKRLSLVRVRAATGDRTRCFSK